MAAPIPSMRDVAMRLLARETARAIVGEHEGVRLCEKMRISLIAFAGAEGFVSLLRRALNLAAREMDASHGIEVRKDGRLVGLEELALKMPDKGYAVSLAITSHLLGLLIVFIGERLTLRLISDAYPDTAWDQPKTRIEAP